MKTAFIYLFMFLVTKPLTFLFSSSTILPHEIHVELVKKGSDIFKPVSEHGVNFIPSNKKNNFQSKGSSLLAGGSISVTPSTIYDNDVSLGAAGINRTVNVKNTGAGVLSLSAASLAGTNADQFILSGLPSFPANINPGDSISFSVAFNPTSVGLKIASISITSDDAVNPTMSVTLRGLGTAGLSGTGEPSLQAILNLLEIQVNVGDDAVSTS
ncbi:MAG: choice-of-anchor D domain-containing protein, partial [Ginsengibacter sp.]